MLSVFASCDESATDLFSYMAFDYYRKERFNARLSLFFKDVITHTLCKRKRFGRRQIKVSLSESVTWLRGVGRYWEYLSFFRLQKMEHWKKWEESSTESVHINKITTHKSHSGTRCDLCSKLNKEEGGRERKKKSGIDVGWNSSKSFWLRHTLAITGESEESGALRVREEPNFENQKNLFGWTRPPRHADLFGWDAASRHSSSCVCVFDSNDQIIIIIINCKSSGKCSSASRRIGCW